MYDRMYGHSRAKNIVYAPYIRMYGFGQPYTLCIDATKQVIYSINQQVAVSKSYQGAEYL